ncbi:MAG TPA: hypothetical protein VKV24_20025 [Casimicrobiaceae bacterium]|nr:hypothetical protein [Casimicrobiaceae bacterium]
MPGRAEDAYVRRRPFAVIVRTPSGNSIVFASFAQRDLAEDFAARLRRQGKRAFVRIDRRLHEVLNESAT